MRTIIMFLFLCPFFCIAQQPDITVDVISNTSRIQFTGLKNNILIGKDVGSPNSTGTRNTFIGLNSGSQHTSGNDNVFTGSDSGISLTTGSFNVFMGSYSGYETTTGNGNVYIGNGAGASDISGSFNVRIGNYAGNNSKGDRNILIGANAGSSHLGDDQLFIDNSSTQYPLIHGDFSTDHLTINGTINGTEDLNIDGDLSIGGELLVNSINVNQITGILGGGYSAVFPEVMDNTVLLYIPGIFQGDVVITSSVGFEIDKFSLPAGSCLDTYSGNNQEFPITFETDNVSDISNLQSWFSSPDNRNMSIIIKDLSGSEVYRINLQEYKPESTGPGSDGRTSFTLICDSSPDTTLDIEVPDYLGSSFSYDPATDELVEISNLISNFTPVVQVDYVNQVITLEMTYNEGEELINWINGFGDASSTPNVSMSIIETTDGMTEISRENFFELIPFKYEMIYGFNLNTKVKTRVQIYYGCNEPG